MQLFKVMIATKNPAPAVPGLTAHEYDTIATTTAAARILALEEHRKDKERAALSVVSVVVGPPLVAEARLSRTYKITEPEMRKAVEQSIYRIE